MGLFRKIFKGKEEKSNKYKLGLNKTRSGAIGNLKKILSQAKIDNNLFDDLEELFISADIGVDTVVKYIEEIKNYVAENDISSPKDLQEVIVDKMFELYLKDEIVNANLSVNNEGLTVYLFVGVNGVGKTTSIAKLAHKLKSEGKSVLLAAGDTFRAGAIEQLKVWGERVDIDVVEKPSGSDPSSVIFEGIQRAKKENYQYLLCDTAGRLQTKVNLMNELAKIKRIIEREIPGAPHETLLVLDATTGQNGLSQAKAFFEATQISGTILTKLDGTAKGGIVLAIRNEFNIPIKFIGLGEKLEDLEVFDIEQYIYGLFADLFE